MSLHNNDSDSKSEILATFLDWLHQAADPQSLVQYYVAKYPQWKQDFIEEAILSRILLVSKSDATIPNLSELDDFQIVRTLASGGMGVVYEAEQLSLGRRVALKIRHGHSSPERELRFLREQEALAQLHQSHIVPIYCAGRCGASQYFVMAYIQGVTLLQILKTVLGQIAETQTLPDFKTIVEIATIRGDTETYSSKIAEFGTELNSQAEDCISETPSHAAGADEPITSKSNPTISLPQEYYRSIVKLIADAAEAIDHAHRKGIFHSDIKPSNIMVDKSEQCWIIDFGLARQLRDPCPSSTAKSVDMPAPPQPDWWGGTPGYMPPEQIQSHGSDIGKSYVPDARSDIWALGTTLFELLTLQRPFTRINAEGTDNSILFKQPKLMPKLVRNLPADLTAICRKALQKNPDDRYQHASEFALDLRNWLGGRATAARPASKLRSAFLWTRRNLGYATAIGAGIILLFAIVLFLIFDARHQAHQSVIQQAAAEDHLKFERDKLRMYERESMIHDVHRILKSDLNNGWTDQTWDLIRQTSKIQPDDRLRTLAVRTLLGLDAHQIRRFPFGGSSVAFDPTGNKVLTGGLEDPSGKTLFAASLWDIQGASGIESEFQSEGPVAFRRDGTPLQLGLQDGHLLLWDVAQHRSICRISLPETVGTTTKNTPPLLALSHHGDFIAASIRIQGEPGKTTVWEVNSGKVVFQTPKLSESLAFSDASDLFSLANFQTHDVEVWSVISQKKVVTLHTGTVPIRSLAFGLASRRNPLLSPGMKPEVLAVGDAGGSITISDLTTQLPIGFCRGSTRDIYSLVFNPDGTLLASGGRHEVQVWEVSTGRMSLRIRPGDGLDFITQIAFSQCGQKLAISSRGVFYKPSMTVWELIPNRGLIQLRGLTGQVQSIVLSPDGKHLAALAQSWEIGIWDTETAQLRSVLQVPPGEFADNATLVFSPDSQQLAYSSSRLQEGTACLFDVNTLQLVKQWRLPPGLQHNIVFADPKRLLHFQVEIPDGSSLPLSSYAWKDHPRICRVRDLYSPRPRDIVSEFRDFNRHIFRALPTPTGKSYIVEGLGGPDGNQRSLKIVNPQTGHATQTFASTKTDKSGHILVDSFGESFFYVPGDDNRLTEVSLSNCTKVNEYSNIPSAIHTGVHLMCNLWFQQANGCYLYGLNSSQPICNFSLDADVKSVIFDKSGNWLIWGGRDGTIVIGNLTEVRKRLKHVNLDW